MGIGMRGRAGGFTLIEVLVVTVIAGIVLALAAANFFPDHRQTAQRETARVVVALEQARDAAVFGGNATAVNIEAHRIVMWKRDDRNTWQSAPNSEQTAESATALDVIALSVGAAPADANARIAFLPDGVGIPFEMRLAYREFSSVISGDALGNLQVRYDR